MRHPWRPAILGLSVCIFAAPGHAAEDVAGKALLERHCARCHALTATTSSPLEQAPNLWVVLRSYPAERLEFELAEGIGSRHTAMPQVQFTSEDIVRIEAYLFGE